MNEADTLARIKSLMKRQTPIAEIFTITPEIAEYLLENNWEENRSLSQSTVDKYSNLLRHGRWDLTGEPFIVNRDGFLIDGQHRCWASIETGLSFTVPIVFGIDREAYRNINCGRVRTLAYRAGLPTAVSAGLGYIIKLAYGPSEVSQPNVRVIEPVYGETIRRMVALQRRRLKVLRTGPTLAAGAIWSRAGAEEYVLKNYAAMMDLDGSECSPCCRSLMKQAVEHDRLSMNNASAVFVRAFRAFDPANARTTRISLKENSAASAMETARGMITAQIEKAGVTFDAKVIETRKGGVRSPTKVAREERARAG